MAQYPVYFDLDLTQNQLIRARFENRASAPTSPVAGQQYYDTSDNTFRGWNGTVWVDLGVSFPNGVVIKGELTNAASNPPYPASPQTGWMYFITTTAGTVGGQVVEIGDLLIYGSSGWFVVQRNLQAASASVAGFIQIGTQAIINAGSDNTQAVTAQTLAGFLVNYLYVRKVVTPIPSLVANTLTTVTHGLGLVGATHVIAQCYQGGYQIGLEIKPVTANSLTVQSNQTLGNVDIVTIG